MKKALLLLAILLGLGLQLHCINHLDMLTYMQGEHGVSCFGSSMATLDFNHDGYKDLIVCSRGWNSHYPNTTYYSEGKVYIYFGGTNFDSVPEIIMTGQYGGQYMSAFNIGDINGDGYDDLCISGYEPPGTPSQQGTIKIYTGSSSTPTQPDISIPYTIANGFVLQLITKIGDINGDGFGDIGFGIRNPDETVSFYVIWGGNYSMSLVFISCPYIYSYFIGYEAIGDINNDGYDDFTIGYVDANIEPNQYYLKLYLGNAAGSFTNSATILQDSTGYNITSSPVGDVNNDGYDDYMGYYNTEGLNVFLGNTNPSILPDVILNPAWNSRGRALKFGDLNNDGFDDVVGSSLYLNGFQVWLGKAQFNGTSDLAVYAPYNITPQIEEFGEVQTMGDYNGDGCCDIAISSYYTWNSGGAFPGYVYIYKGNTQLTDTTVAIEDDTQLPRADINVKVFPNPINPSTTISFSIPKESNVKVTMYNVKGQIVKRLCHESLKKGLHKLVWDGKNDQGRSAGSGIYFIRLETQDKTIIKKAMMLK